MPSDNLLLYFQKHLKIVNHWVLDGTHYEKTSNHWLANMERNKAAALASLAETYGKADALKWFVNWKLFFIAVAELFGYANGSEWIVSHYLFTNSDS